MERQKKPRPPHKWVTQAYRLLAAGRYATEWLPELLVLYDATLAEEGEEAAHDLAIRELGLSVKPSLVHRLYQIFRILHRMWKIYSETVRD